eukprot:scaffold160399_cov20-Tisochrysis_lutea.AAC.1
MPIPRHAGGGISTSAGTASVHQPGSSITCTPTHVTSTHLQHRHAQHASGTTNPAAQAQMPGTHRQGSCSGAAVAGDATRNAGNSACGGVTNGNGTMHVGGAQK